MYFRLRRKRSDDSVHKLLYLPCVSHLSSPAAWADNANACAKQYAGTGALKTDFTRWAGQLCLSLLCYDHVFCLICVLLWLLGGFVMFALSLWSQDREENSLGSVNGWLELDDQILQEQLLRWIQTGGLMSLRFCCTHTLMFVSLC